MVWRHIQAAEPKKETAAPPAAAEAAPNTKAKEEPKAATKTAEASVEIKPSSEAAQGGDESAKAPKKLEKRNSINLFFKTLVGNFASVFHLQRPGTHDGTKNKLNKIIENFYFVIYW